MNASDNPPAFPQLVGIDSEQWDSRHGMTLRDWFAGQAICGMLANEGNNAVIASLAREARTTVDAYLAQAAFNAADAMLAERERQS